MSLTETQQTQQAALHTKLWAIANDLRGNMEASEFKNYILGLIFYKYLSEKVEDRADKLLEEDNMTYEKAWEDEEIREALKEELLEQIGYFVEPNSLFSTLMRKIEDGTFDVEMLQGAVNDISESTLGSESQDDFDHLFDDMDLASTKLGKDVKSRSKLIAKVMGNIAEISFKHEDSEIDVLGDAYEYLISQFAATAGKKAGEFYTPQNVSKILAKLVTLDKQDLKNVYDPCCGSGSLLLRVSKEANVRKFYGQELTSTTYNLARMNMLLHDVSYQNFDIRNDDTIENPKHLEEKFDAIVANPPYSANWSAEPKFLDDERFSAYGKLAPKSKADYAFVQHMIYQLDDKGTMAVVLPHGVLFRGAAEGTIREYLIKDKNYLDGIIGLPANLFYGTSIPTVILVFKKCREKSNDVLFIDASNEFEKGKNQNILRECDINKIMETYKNRETIEKYSYVASLDEIAENDYNLNIPRYVDTFEEEETIDIEEVKRKIQKIDDEIADIDKELEVYLRELGI
ncbi:type I restriction-modification system subunit M [Clostridium diolis]|uniref:type I restriction-modification system subunit M n=1 Tax=Clostridium diolis TaxID=223919 RepID=UPI000B3F6E3F|nr:type I restriction-modification system subunit M [Clostridium diolis]OVE68234.1 type I restriction-modification system subunit M [Clostridium diolis]